MNNILESQRQFFQLQKTKKIVFRINALKRLRNEIIAHEDTLCTAMFKDFKKPVFESLVTETQFVLAEIAEVVKHITFWAKPERVSSSMLNWPSKDFVYREPYGNVLIIAPWNYPFQLAIAPLIGAVAAGNTVVVKPSELTPNTAKVISTIIQASFDPGHVAVIEGGAEVSQSLLKERWDYIFFTGSTRVGKIVYESAARHLTPVTLELGGKSPCIVDETASIATSAKRIVWGKFLNAGQTCIAPDYVLVHESVKDALVEGLIKNIDIFYGPEVESSQDYARIVGPKHFNALKEMLQDEEIVFGGQMNEHDFYLAPTLVNEPSLDSKLMSEEIFGPILPIISFKTDADLGRYLEHFDRPLAAYIFSNKKSFQNRLLESYRFGGGAINDTVVHVANKNLPFGGIGKSGMGSYHGKRSFDTFSHFKSIVKKAIWPDIPLRYPPYNLPERLVKMIKSIL